MQTITLKYTKSATVYSKSFSVLYVKGFDPLDDFELISEQFRALSGYTQDAVAERPLKRRFTIDFGNVDAFNDRLWLLDWLKNPSARKVSFTHDSISEELVVTVPNLKRIVTEWYMDTETMRSPVLVCDEATPLADYPATSPATGDENMYAKSYVEITGTEDSPQELVTNSAPLGTCDAPAGAYPPFDDTTHVISVELDGAVYQDKHVNLVGRPTVDGSGNVHAFVAKSDAGEPATDGSTHADVIIRAIAK